MTAIDVLAVGFPAAIAAQSTTATELFEGVFDPFVQLLGFALLSAGVAAAAAAIYRWYSREEIPEGIGVLIGLTIVAVWLNTRGALSDAILGQTDLLDPVTAVYTIGTFVAAGIAADLGRRLGDRASSDVFVTAAPRNVDEMTQLVRAAGRVIAVTLPKEIDDVDGYDPVDAETKADLAGRTLVFPRRLSVDELKTRLSSRLQRDYGVGHVDVDLTPDGTVEYLAIGSRPSGIGPTLAPGSLALAISADPAPDASPGDAIAVWTRDEGADRPRRVASAELRSTAGDVATITVEAEDVPALANERPYRLVTLPGAPDAAREFVALMRAADETVTTVAVDDDFLAGETVGSLEIPVLAIDRSDDVFALPNDGEVLESGDVAYVIGRSEELRRLHERTSPAS